MFIKYNNWLGGGFQVVETDEVLPYKNKDGDILLEFTVRYTDGRMDSDTTRIPAECLVSITLISP